MPSPSAARSCSRSALTPVLAARVLRPEQEGEEGKLMRFFHRLYDPLFDQALRRPKLAVALRCIPVFACVVLFPLLGREFMPKLEEGNFWVRATFPTSISLEQTARYVPKIRNILLGCPMDPKASAPGRAKASGGGPGRSRNWAGRTTAPTSAGFNNLELFAPLRPFDEWPAGLTKDEAGQISSPRSCRTRFPGVIFNFSQYISDNVEEAVSGIKGENSVKVVGPDLEIDDRKAPRSSDVMSKVDGSEGPGRVQVDRPTGREDHVDRVACERYGLNTGDVEHGDPGGDRRPVLTEVYEGEQHYDLTVRWDENYRKSLDAIRRITVPTSDGNYIPLAQLARDREGGRPTVIYRQEGYRYTPVKFSVRGRDLAGTIEEAQRKIASEGQVALRHAPGVGRPDQRDERRPSRGCRSSSP